MKEDPEPFSLMEEMWDGCCGSVQLPLDAFQAAAAASAVHIFLYVCLSGVPLLLRREHSSVWNLAPSAWERRFAVTELYIQDGRSQCDITHWEATRLVSHLAPP